MKNENSVSDKKSFIFLFILYNYYNNSGEINIHSKKFLQLTGINKEEIIEIAKDLSKEGFFNFLEEEHPFINLYNSSTEEIRFRIEKSDFEKIIILIEKKIFNNEGQNNADDTLLVIYFNDYFSFDILELINQDIESIMPILNETGYSGHLNLHEWLKNNKSAFFKKYINDTDKNRFVIDLLIKLKNFYSLNN